jgi:hypothetical protein
LEKYKFNQLAFVEGDQRFMLRQDNWYSAPRQQGVELEMSFEALNGGIDPIQEAVGDPSRRRYLMDQINRYRAFSESIPM